MSFGVTQDEVVIIERQATPDRCHLYPHDQREALITRLYAGAVLEIEAGAGEVHVYPGDKVVGLHFGHIPNYTRATMQLWQDSFGLGKAGETNASSLYVVDPAVPDHAWKIQTGTLRNGNFRTLATGLIEGTTPYVRALHSRVPIDELDQPEHVATFVYYGHDMKIHKRTDTEGRGAGLAGPVAGPLAVEFIGLEDMNADDRN